MYTPSITEFVSRERL